MKLELKANQAVLILEQGQHGVVRSEIKSGSDQDNFLAFLCEAMSDKMTEEDLWNELVESAEEKQLESTYEKAHKHSIFHRAEIMKSNICGCFSCMETYPPDEIEWWTDTNKEFDKQTAVCPHCLTDAVIGDASGYPVINSFLVGMCQRWFGDTVVRIYEERVKAFYGK